MVVEKKYATNYSVQNSVSDNSTQKQIFFNDLKTSLNRIVDKLPEQQSRIFKLSRFDGFSNKEIATKLGISLRTVENLLFRASKFVKKQLEDEKLLILLGIISYFSNN